MMNEVIKICDIKSDRKEIVNPIVYTHLLNNTCGWKETTDNPEDKVVYLGHCPIDGDMFAEIGQHGHINIYKGKLNSGNY